MLVLLTALAIASDPFATPKSPSYLETHELGAAIPAGAPEPVPLTEAQRGRAKKVLDAARGLLDIAWKWGGRNTDSHPGIDCLGLMFLADGAVSERSWRAYEVNPSELVAGGKLGEPVPGLDGVLRTEVRLESLMPGDAVYFLRAGYVIEDEPLMERDGTSYWPWHTGLYVGDGQVIHADPGGVVRLQELAAVRFDALLVTRLP